MASAPLFTQDPPAWVRPYLGIPYRVLDCWKLCGHIVKSEASVDLPTFEEDLAHTADETLWALRLRATVRRVAEREKVNGFAWHPVDGDPQAFDIALYQVHGRPHVATVAGGGWAINTDLRRGSHVIRLRESNWARLLEGFYRHASLDR